MTLEYIKRLIKRVPLLRGGAIRLANIFSRPFSGSANYWERRYAAGGTSGPGSYRHLALYKADVLNQFVIENNIKSVIEFGCGDGNQLSLADYPQYLGFDVSPTAIEVCNNRFAGDRSKNFKLLSDYDGEQAELVLSLDVIYHLVEDDVFSAYIEKLFSSALRFVIIYSSNTNDIGQISSKHVRHRRFTDFIEQSINGWRLRNVVTNKYKYNGIDEASSFADFYIYEATGASPG